MNEFVKNVLSLIKADNRFRLVEYREFKKSQKPDSKAVGVAQLETAHTENTAWELRIQLREDGLVYWISDTEWTPRSNLPWREIRKCEDFAQVRDEFLQVRYVKPDEMTAEEEAEIDRIIKELEDLDD